MISPDNVEAASRRLDGEDSASLAPIGYFDPEMPVAHLSGDLPHWRQEGATYFVTFRLADSLPQEKLTQWKEEQQQWLRSNPEPHTPEQREDYYKRFPRRLQTWLDAGHGSLILDIPEIKTLVEGALQCFDGKRYHLDKFVVASNHVHALVTPLPGSKLSDILHSWKSYTAHEILKVEAASRRLLASRQRPGAPKYSAANTKPASALPNRPAGDQSRDGSATDPLAVWQKESFDHIVRSPASLEKFRAYIQAHTASDP